MRFRDDNPADLARARSAVTAWRDQNPAGTGDELVAAVGRQFHPDYGGLLRLARFRAAHPEVIIGDGGFGTVQARIPEPDGETVITRYMLSELLDRLDELTTEPNGQPGCEPS